MSPVIWITRCSNRLALLRSDARQIHRGPVAVRRRLIQHDVIVVVAAQKKNGDHVSQYRLQESRLVVAEAVVARVAVTRPGAANHTTPVAAVGARCREGQPFARLVGPCDLYRRMNGLKRNLSGREENV